jgi:hypothetical protein
MKIIIYSKKERKIGDTMTIGCVGEDFHAKGKVVRLVSEDKRYHNQRLCGGKVINSADNFYEVEV